MLSTPRERNLRDEQKRERRTNSKNVNVNAHMECFKERKARGRLDFCLSVSSILNEISSGVLVGTRKFLVRGRVYRIEVLVEGLEGKEE